MRSYRIINNYEIVNRVSPFMGDITITDLRSNPYYLICSAICFEHNPSSLKVTGYNRFLGEVSVFEEDDIIPYIYK